MIEAALVIILALFVLGIVKIPGVTIPNYHLFTFNHHVITLFEVLIVIVAFGVLLLLPKFMRVIIGALLIIWIVSTLGIIVVNGLPAVTIIVLMIAITLHRSFHWDEDIAAAITNRSIYNPHATCHGSSSVLYLMSIIRLC